MKLQLVHVRLYTFCTVITGLRIQHSTSAPLENFYRNLKERFSEPSPNPATSSLISRTASEASDASRRHRSTLNEEKKVTTNLGNRGRDSDLMDINNWDYIPAEFFEPATSNPTKASSSMGNSRSTHTFSSAMSPFREPYRKQVSATSSTANGPWNLKMKTADQNGLADNTHYGAIGNTGRDNSAMRLSSSPMLLPLADHIAGSSLSINPDQTQHWSALPISRDTHYYTNPRVDPTARKLTLDNGESFAEAILRGQTKRWEWSYVSSVLEGEAGLFNSTNGSSNRMSCCIRLPYICSVDSVCMLEPKQCHEFCECAAHPAMPHCRTVIPEIKRVMAVREREMLTRLARNLNMTPPPERVTRMPEWKYITHPSRPNVTHTVSDKPSIVTATQTNFITKTKSLTIPTATFHPTSAWITPFRVTAMSRSTPPTPFSAHKDSSTKATSAVPTYVHKSKTKLLNNTADINKTGRTLLKDSKSTFNHRISGNVMGVTNSTLSAPPLNGTFTTTRPITTIKLQATKPPPHNPVSRTTNANISSLPNLDVPVEETNSDLVDNRQQNTLFSWFRFMGNNTIRHTTSTPVDAPSNSSILGRADNPTLRASEISNSSVATPSFRFCSADCETQGGTCVMGNDFLPHCIVVAPDACDHFHCINGECVADDGVYKCECDQGWAGTFCDTQCPLDCGQYGYCSAIGGRETAATEHGSNNINGITMGNNNNNSRSSHNNISGISNNKNNSNNKNSTAEIVCICHWNRTGSNCEDIRKIVPRIYQLEVPTDHFPTWQVALVSILAAIVLALLCVLVPYFLWRRSWLPMRKLVYYFQEYEDDDDKEFDAFVSYKSSPRDERFVLQQLYPKLEQELGFRLCLHFRDFPPGEAIANNIIHAVERSRRTILVLSPNYVSSEWCRLEYQKAQHEMLKLRHKIIPVILEDVRKVSGVDKALRTIMDTVTYIEWPGEQAFPVPDGARRNIDLSTNQKAAVDRFWKLLTCSMPKKRKSGCVDRFRRGISHAVNDLALTTVGEEATAVTASQNPQLLRPIAYYNDAMVQDGEFLSAHQFSCNLNGRFIGNNSTTLIGIYNGDKNRPPDSHRVRSTGSIPRITNDYWSPSSSFPSDYGRQQDLSSISTSTADSPLTSRDSEKSVTSFNAPPVIKERPSTNATANKRTTSLNLRSSLNHQQPNYSHGRSQNNSARNESHAADDSDERTQAPCPTSSTASTKDFIGSEALADSGVSSSCGSSRSSTEGGVKAERSDTSQGKMLNEQSDSGLRKHQSSDDHIVEIRNIGNKVVITPRPRTLFNNSYL
ncbi:protein toll [Elysia marginata]|uniref:Protein toll n=1 Tax=Elysia marginata TaxID=1093978 RepID=A0AAV4JMF4_9GAST|nr:protein toll [Elysia marginata]